MEESELTDTQQAILRLLRAYPERSFTMSDVVEQLPDYDPGNIYFGLGVLTGGYYIGIVSSDTREYRFIWRERPQRLEQS
jgi:hypothetical protein